jgi:hypothetical protein
LFRNGATADFTLPKSIRKSTKAPKLKTLLAHLPRMNSEFDSGLSSYIRKTCALYCQLHQ